MEGEIRPEYITLWTGRENVQTLVVDGLVDIRNRPEFRDCVEEHGGELHSIEGGSGYVEIYPPIPNENRAAFLAKVALLINNKNVISIFAGKHEVS
jgi:hypothetical protein